MTVKNWQTAATGPGNTRVEPGDMSFNDVMAQAKAYAKESTSQWQETKAVFNEETGEIELMSRAKYKYGPDASTEWQPAKFGNSNSNPRTKFNDMLRIANGLPSDGYFEKTSAGEYVYKLGGSSGGSMTQEQLDQAVIDTRKAYTANQNDETRKAYNDALAAKKAGPGSGGNLGDDGPMTGGDDNPYGGDSGSSVGSKGYDAALKQLQANPQFQALPYAIQSTMITTLGKDLPNADFETIIAEFKKESAKSIDPRFSREVDAFTAQVTREYEQLQSERADGLEIERANAGTNIRQARGDLEASGMTFTGQGIEQLGEKSAFSKDLSSIPSQQATDGQNLTSKEGMTFSDDGRFFEGSINQANRLMSSSGALRYQKSLNTLGQNAENALGGGAMSGLFPGYTASGDMPGSIEDRKQDDYAATIAAIAQRQRDKYAINKDIDYNFN